MFENVLVCLARKQKNYHTKSRPRLVHTFVHLMPPRLLSPSLGAALANPPRTCAASSTFVASSNRCSALGTAATSRVRAGPRRTFSSNAYAVPYSHINLAGPSHAGKVRSFRILLPNLLNASHSREICALSSGHFILRLLHAPTQKIPIKSLGYQEMPLHQRLKSGTMRYAMFTRLGRFISRPDGNIPPAGKEAPSGHEQGFQGF